MKIDSSLVNQWIQNRRSIYPNMYSGETIRDELIDQILENANWAPTHRLTEPWRFVVFVGEGLKQFATFQSELYRQSAQRDGSFDPGQFQKLQTKPLLASHIISIGMKRDDKESVPEIEEVCSVASAVQNMYLTASALGLGCYWTTGGVTYQEEAKPFFGLTEKDKLMGFLYLGIPKSGWPKGRRGAISDKVQWVRESS